MGHHGHGWHSNQLSSPNTPTTEYMRASAGMDRQDKQDKSRRLTCHTRLLAFVKDLLNDPKTRDVTDVTHEVVAAASSSSKSRAETFFKDCGVPGSPKAYGSYAELVADPDVQIIYVATPHSHHFQNAMLALEAGKNVLCEKALTVNASQAKKLVAKAREKNLFFMEAVWTRYFPLSIKIRELITSGEIGTVYRVTGEFWSDYMVSTTGHLSCGLHDRCGSPLRSV